MPKFILLLTIATLIASCSTRDDRGTLLYPPNAEKIPQEKEIDDSINTENNDEDLQELRDLLLD